MYENQEYTRIDLTFIHLNTSNSYRYRLEIVSSCASAQGWYTGSDFLNIFSGDYFLTWVSTQGTHYTLALYITYKSENSQSHIHRFDLWIIITLTSLGFMILIAKYTYSLKNSIIFKI